MKVVVKTEEEKIEYFNLTKFLSNENSGKVYRCKSRGDLFIVLDEVQIIKIEAIGGKISVFDIDTNAFDAEIIDDIEVCKTSYNATLIIE